MKEPQIMIQSQTGVPSAIAAAFKDTLDKLEIPYESHEAEAKAYAGVEDYLPGIVAVYLLKPFIETILKEAGKDAYNLFKSSMRNLVEEASKLKVELITTGPNKVDLTSLNSRAISIHATAQDGSRVKFLIPKNLSEKEATEVVDEAFSILNANYSSEEKDLISERPRLPRGGHTTLLEYDREAREFAMKIPEHIKRLSKG